MIVPAIEFFTYKLVNMYILYLCKVQPHRYLGDTNSTWFGLYENCNNYFHSIRHTTMSIQLMHWSDNIPDKVCCHRCIYSKVLLVKHLSLGTNNTWS